MILFLKKATVHIVEKICAIYGDGAIVENTVYKWFSSVRSGNLNLEDQKYSRQSLMMTKAHNMGHCTVILHISYDSCNAFEKKIK